jgi:selenide,water dikinase
VLSQVLGNLNKFSTKDTLIDYKSFDDAAAYNLNNETILQTVDFFTPIVDDPYDFGRIAAANSLSDIYAMGGKPLFALNIVAFPVDDLPLSVLTDILRGGSDVASEAGIPILGGHSIKDKEPKYGLVVTGTPFKTPIKNSTAQPGDVIILTKPLGLGIISTAIKKDLADKNMIDEAVNIMTYLNKDASEAMISTGANACTDITGYGLLGHLLEMCKGSKLSANINFDSIKFIDGSKELAAKGIVPGGTKRNYDFIKGNISFSNDLEMYQKYLLADAQTSGGLLISIPKEKLDELNSKLSSTKYECMEIGSFAPLESDQYIKVS